MAFNDGEQGSGGDAGAGAAAGASGDEQGGAGGEQQQQQGADPDWYANLSAEAEGESAGNRDFAKAKGWKSLDDVVKSYREAERVVRDSGRIKVPGDAAAPEEVAGFHRAIGVPEAADGYAIEAPKAADGTPIPLNDGLIKLVTEAGVKFGVPKAALEGVLGEVLKGDLDALAAQDRQQNEAAAKWVKDQGAAADEKTAAIDRAADALGLSAKEVTALRSAWGSERALTIMSKLGEGLAEDKLLHGGDRQRFGVSGVEAQTQLNTLKADPEFVRKAAIKGSPENMRWNRLNDAAAEHARRQAEGDG